MQKALLFCPESGLKIALEFCVTGCIKYDCNQFEKGFSFFGAAKTLGM